MCVSTLNAFFFDEKLKQWEQVHALARSLAERSESEKRRKMRSSNCGHRASGAHNYVLFGIDSFWIVN